MQFQFSLIHLQFLVYFFCFLFMQQSYVEAVVGDGGYYKKRMEKSMKNNKNTEGARFIGPPGNGEKNYGNRLKVEETFSRYKRIIGNKFKAQHFLGQQNEAKISLLILNIRFKKYIIITLCYIEVGYIYSYE